MVLNVVVSTTKWNGINYVFSKVFGSELDKLTRSYGHKNMMTDLTVCANSSTYVPLETTIVICFLNDFWYVKTNYNNEEVYTKIETKK